MIDSGQVYTVSDAIKLVNGKLRALGSITISGEVVGFRGPHARSGHCYFDIKDGEGKLSVAVWKGIYQASGVQLQDGMQLEIVGHFDVYPRGGSMSFVAERLEVAGEGLLLQQIEMLKRKLAAEGLFDADKKVSPPQFCERVICVTSLSGEVKDDVLQNINPLVDLSFVGCRVEGQGAVQEIIKALKIAESYRPDAILLVRGGGSLESLMTFNDEELCRAVAACTVPVISGVGHEPDVTICDFVADVRCSTPTAAAQKVAPAFSFVVNIINERANKMSTLLAGMVKTQSTELEHTAGNLHRFMQGHLESEQLKLSALADRPCLQSPTFMVDERRDALMLDEQRLYDAWPRYMSLLSTNTAHLAERLAHKGSGLLQPYKDTTGRLAATLDALSPLKVLGRGYAITTTDQGHVVSDASQLAVGDSVNVRLGKGNFEAQVGAIKASQ